jgi:citrate synthase
MPRARQDNLARSIRLFAALPRSSPTASAVAAARNSSRRATTDYAANFLWMTFGEFDDVVVDAFNRSMILYAEHSFNASTFTARVITSTLSDLYSAVVGAIGALKGPLHGGANEAVLHIFDEIGDADNVVPWLDDALATSARSWASGTASTSAATRACRP